MHREEEKGDVEEECRSPDRQTVGRKCKYPSRQLMEGDGDTIDPTGDDVVGGDEATIRQRLEEGADDDQEDVLCQRSGSASRCLSGGDSRVSHFRDVSSNRG